MCRIHGARESPNYAVFGIHGADFPDQCQTLASRSTGTCDVDHRCYDIRLMNFDVAFGCDPLLFYRMVGRKDITLQLPPDFGLALSPKLQVAAWLRLCSHSLRG